MMWLRKHKDDIEAVFTLASMFIVAFAVGALTATLGDWWWRVFRRLGATSAAVEWIAHLSALLVSIIAAYCVFYRLLHNTWPWSDHENTDAH